MDKSQSFRTFAYALCGSLMAIPTQSWVRFTGTPSLGPDWPVPNLGLWLNLSFFYLWALTRIEPLQSYVGEASVECSVPLQWAQKLQMFKVRASFIKLLDSNFKCEREASKFWVTRFPWRRTFLCPPNTVCGEPGTQNPKAFCPEFFPGFFTDYSQLFSVRCMSKLQLRSLLHEGLFFQISLSVCARALDCEPTQRKGQHSKLKGDVHSILPLS